MIAADELTAAFRDGDAALAFDAGTRLVEAYRSLSVEAAQLRFQLNFGTAVCKDCDGLRAGPGVVATCFQVQQCNYSNIKEDEASPKQLRMIQTLLDEPQNTLTPKKR